MFSMDLVGNVAGFLVCGPVIADAQPQILVTFEQSLDCTSLALSPEGTVWVTTPQGVHIFTDDGVFKDGWRTCDVTPNAFAFDTNGEVFATNITERIITVHKLDGQVLRYFDGEVMSPTDIATNGKGLIFVADYWGHCIKVFRRDGTPVACWGGDTQRKFDEDGYFLLKGPGETGPFCYPHSVCYNAGEVYVSDTMNDRIQVRNCACDRLC